MSGAVARRYTSGLFAFARDNGLIEAVDQGLQVVADALRTNPDFKSLIENPLVSAEDKMAVLDAVFAAHVDPAVIRFVKLLVMRKRVDQLMAVYDSFHALAEASKGVVEVTVESALPVADEQLAELERQLSAALNKQARAVVRVNPDLIAGYRVQVANRVLDASVRGALQQFGNRLQSLASKGSAV